LAILGRIGLRAAYSKWLTGACPS
jgi:predicted phage terminase large subunit-like protein